MDQNVIKTAANVAQEDVAGKILEDISGIIGEVSNHSFTIRDKIVGSYPQCDVAPPRDTTNPLSWLRTIREDLCEIRDVLNEANRSL